MGSLVVLLFCCSFRGSCVLRCSFRGSCFVVSGVALACSFRHNGFAILHYQLQLLCGCRCSCFVFPGVACSCLQLQV